MSGLFKSLSVATFLVFVFSLPLCARPFETIKKSGEIRLCTAGSAYEYYEEMGRAFASWLKVKPVVTHLPSWDSQFHSTEGQTEKDTSYTPELLSSGQCDIYPNDLVVNDWRKNMLDFEILYQTRMVVSIHKDNTGNFNTLDDLAGKTMAVMQNSSYHSWAEERNAFKFKKKPIKFKFMETYDAWKAVDKKEVDFTISNADGVFKKSGKYTNDMVVAFPVGPITNVGWGYAKEDKVLGKKIHLFFEEQQRRDSVFDMIWLNHGLRLSDYMLFMAEML